MCQFLKNRFAILPIILAWTVLALVNFIIYYYNHSSHLERLQKSSVFKVLVNISNTLFFIPHKV